MKNRNILIDIINTYNDSSVNNHLHYKLDESNEDFPLIICNYEMLLFKVEKLKGETLTDVFRRANTIIITTGINKLIADSYE